MAFQQIPGKQHEDLNLLQAYKEGDFKHLDPKHHTAAGEMLQEALNKEGANLNVDGAAGKGTIAALKKYQEAHGLEPTGKVDEKTAEALFHTMEGPEATRAREDQAVRIQREAQAYESDPAYKQALANMHRSGMSGGVDTHEVGHSGHGGGGKEIER